MGMLLKRIRIALDLSLRFIFHPEVLIVAAIPIVLWPLKRLLLDLEQVILSL